MVEEEKVLPNGKGFKSNHNLKIRLVYTINQVLGTRIGAPSRLISGDSDFLLRPRMMYVNPSLIDVSNIYFSAE